MKNPLIGTSVIGLFAAISLSAAAAEMGGRVAMTEGKVMLQRGAESMPAERGSVLAAGDELRTLIGSRAQIWMEDDALIALASPTQFGIDEYRPQQGTAEYRLQEGGFRLVSGSVKPLVRTPMGNMQTIGTDVTAVICIAVCVRGPGLYVTVDKGRVKLSNAAGSLEVGAGQFALMASRSTPPVLIEGGPTLTLLFADVAFQFDLGALEFNADVVVQPLLPIPEIPGSPS